MRYDCTEKQLGPDESLRCGGGDDFMPEGERTSSCGEKLLLASLKDNR